jgi:hypothetical protein
MLHLYLIDFRLRGVCWRTQCNNALPHHWLLSLQERQKRFDGTISTNSLPSTSRSSEDQSQAGGQVSIVTAAHCHLLTDIQRKRA